MGRFKISSARAIDAITMRKQRSLTTSSAPSLGAKGTTGNVREGCSRRCSLLDGLKTPALPPRKLRMAKDASLEEGIEIV